MEERENRKGPGVFYAVIGVATLVVAIIGATFAYFSVTATNNTAVTGDTSDAGGLSLTVTPVGSTSTNLIPLNLIVNQTLKADSTTEYVDATDQFVNALTTTAGGAQCKDSNGNNVCQIYRIELTNNSTTSSIQVRGKMTLASPNTENMYWQLLTDDSSVNVSRAAFATNVKQGTEGDITVMGNTGHSGYPAENAANAASHSIGKGSTGTYYVLVWLEETGSAQETADAKVAQTETTTGKNTTWTGTVTFNAVDNQGNVQPGVTATFNS